MREVAPGPASPESAITVFKILPLQSKRPRIYYALLTQRRYTKLKTAILCRLPGYPNLSAKVSAFNIPIIFFDIAHPLIGFNKSQFFYATVCLMVETEILDTVWF